MSDMKERVSDMEDREIRNAVRDQYGGIATQDSGGCGCGPQVRARDVDGVSAAMGYTQDQIDGLPEGANLGLGCGNPTALASLEPGDVVLDLGSGAGIDCFLAARRVGPSGRVIGVDMTPEMLDRARRNAEEGGHDNVEFRLGEIENLPVADASVDVIISNCVINLVPDKTRAFAEAFRVLRPGGRLLVSDIVLTTALPDEIAGSVAAYTGCIAGATPRDEYLAAIDKAGFVEVEVVSSTAAVGQDDELLAQASSFAASMGLDVSPEVAHAVATALVSASVSARKPR